RQVSVSDRIEDDRLVLVEALILVALGVGRPGSSRGRSSGSVLNRSCVEDDLPLGPGLLRHAQLNAAFGALTSPARELVLYGEALLASTAGEGDHGGPALLARKCRWRFIGVVVAGIAGAAGSVPTSRRAARRSVFVVFRLVLPAVLVAL